MFNDSWLNPTNWFLNRTEKKKLSLKRRYYGESLERAIIDVDFPVDTHRNENLASNLKVDERFGRIDAYTLRCKLANLAYEDKESVEYQQELLQIKKDFKKINDQEFAKESATIKNEPWVTVLSLNMDPAKPTDGSFELDWNQRFVEVLKEAGYKGERPELIVQDWFDSLCKNIAKEYGAVFPEEVKEFDYKNQTRKVKDVDSGKVEIM